MKPRGNASDAPAAPAAFLGRTLRLAVASVALLSALGAGTVSNSHAEEVQLSTDSQPSIASIWNWSDIPATEDAFRREAAKADSAKDLARALAMETQVARCLGLQQKFDAAHAVLDSVEKHLTAGISSASTQASEVEVRLRLERGRAWNSAGNAEAARRPFADAFEIAVAEKIEYLAIDAAHMMAIVETGDASRVWFERGVQMAEGSVDPAARSWLGPLYNNYGWTLHDGGHYEEALTIFEKAVDWRKENSGPVQVRIARYAVARTLRSLGRCPDALVILGELEQGLLAAGESDGFIDEEMAECLLVTGKKKEAQPYFRKAFELLSADPWLQRDEAERLARLEELAGP